MIAILMSNSYREKGKSFSLTVRRIKLPAPVTILGIREEDEGFLVGKYNIIDFVDNKTGIEYEIAESHHAFMHNTQSNKDALAEKEKIARDIFNLRKRERELDEAIEYVKFST